MKLISWNIDSVNAALTSESNRAVLSRDVLRTILSYDPDIIAIQETKLPAKGPNKKHIEILDRVFDKYALAWNSSVEPARKSYAGTMFLFKREMDPLISLPSIGAPEPMDAEGRIITLEFEKYFVTQVYTPNAGDGLRRLKEREIWDRVYADYLTELDSIKPVLAVGDYNVAHKEIDLAHPESNRMSAGFTDEERAGFTHLLSRGFVDTFRYKNGDVEGAYTWWAQRVKTSKLNNSGWRIDYALTSERVKKDIIQSEMIDSGPRQDHAPILLEIEI